MHGGVFPGMPFIAKGFNPDIGWGVTVNKPDLVDIYRLTPKGEGYLLDGAEVAFERRRIWLKLKIIGNFYLPIPRITLAADMARHWKPTMAHALRFAGMGELRQPAQWMAMNKARNLKQFKAAMAMQAIVSFNFVYADRAGNIYFLHNGKPRYALPDGIGRNIYPATAAI